MNIALAIMHLHSNAEPLRDFVVQDNGPEPELRPGAEEKGRIRYEIKPPEEGEEPVEGVHYRYGIDYNLLTEGEDYVMEERGQYIAVWNLDVPQPTEEELQVAWEAYKEAEANKPPALTETELIQIENAGLAIELAMTQMALDQTQQEQAALIFSLVEGGVI